MDLSPNPAPINHLLNSIGNVDLQMWYSIPHMWYVEHTKNCILDFDNDSYAQNSEIILTIRIQKKVVA